MHTIRISAKSMRQEFAGCQPDYIRDVCHASCCRSSTAPNGIVVTIHRSEQAATAVDHWDGGGGDFWATMDDATWNMLMDNDATKRVRG